MMQDSIGGNSKTTLIITCSPSKFNSSESLSTCRFGERAKKIKNIPKINRELTKEELEKQLEKIKKKVRIKDLRIKALEDFIVNMGVEVPNNVYDDYFERRTRNNSISSGHYSKIFRNFEDLSNLKISFVE